MRGQRPVAAMLLLFHSAATPRWRCSKNDDQRGNASGGKTRAVPPPLNDTPKRLVARIACRSVAITEGAKHHAVRSTGHAAVCHSRVGQGDGNGVHQPTRVAAW